MTFSVIKQQRLWWTFSGLLIIAGIAAMVISLSTFGSPLRLGLDFVGGTRLQYELECSPNNCGDQVIEAAKVRDILSDQGLGDSSIQVVENHGILIRSKTLNVDQRTKLEAALTEKIGKFNPAKTQIDTVGPTLGQELFKAGILALILSFSGISLYLSFRFQWDYALYAMVALAHDVLITIGIFAILGLFLPAEIDSLFVVAILTIIGFSVNDTVVIYDRIRENIAIYPEESFNEVVDISINQTMTRSINTTLTTLLPLTAIFIFGGETLKYFSLALIIGFTAGVYSSIFIASTLLAWGRRFESPKKALAE